MTDDQVWLQVYCAALTGLLANGRTTQSKNKECQEAAAYYADEALKRYRVKRDAL
jgi:hypothetical protein